MLLAQYILASFYTKKAMRIVFLFTCLNSVFLQQQINAQDKFFCEKLQKPAVYFVKSGDSLANVLQGFSLAPLWRHQRFVEQAVKINKIENPDILQIGQVLYIPFECKSDVLPVLVNESTKYYFVDYRVKTKPTPMLAEQDPTKKDDLEFDRSQRPYTFKMGGALQYGFRRIDSVIKDASDKATALSKPEYGASIKMRRYWRRWFATEFNANLMKVALEKADEGLLYDFDKNLGAADFQFFLGRERLSFILRVGYEQEVDLTPVEAGVAKGDVHAHTKIGFGVHARLFKLRSIALDTQIKMRRLKEYEALLELSREFSTKVLRLDIGYRVMQQEREFTQSDSKFITAGIGLDFMWGKK